MKSLFISLLLSSIVFASNVDLTKSHVQWTGSKITGASHTGKAFFKSANFTKKESKLVSGEFVVNIDSFIVEDLKGNTATKFLGHMKSADFFEVTKYPTAKLKITSVKGNKAFANLTIKNKTHPVEFKYNINGKKLLGKFEINRTKYNMIYGSGSFFKNLGDKVIKDKVELEFNIVLK